jgi:hypothetical protein
MFQPSCFLKVAYSMFYVPIRQLLRNSNGSESTCADVLTAYWLTQLRFMSLFWVGKPEQSRMCYVSELLNTTQQLTTDRSPIQTRNMHTHPSRKTQLAYAINTCLCLKTVFGREFKLQTAGLSCFH